MEVKITIKQSKMLNEEYSMFVSFPYNEEMVDYVRGLMYRTWIKDSKEWEIPVTELGEFVKHFPKEKYTIEGMYINLTKKEVEVPSDFNFKTKPFQHQIEGFNFGLNHDRWLLADEQGLGKTKQVIDIAVAKKQQFGFKHCLIVCGVNGLKWNWQREVATHSNQSAWILGQKVRKDGSIVVGSTQDKLNDLVNLPDSYFLITNVETLRDKQVVDKIRELCDNETIGLVAVDEVHKCKNHTSQQGKGILKINAKVKIAMTGTPVMNNPLDLYVILKWLGYEKHSNYSFKNHYCVMGGYGGYEIVSYKNMDELQDRLDKIMLRRLKKDVLDLPEKLFVNEYVEMTAKQSIIYKEVANDVKMNVDKITASANPLSMLTRLRQATGYTGILSSEIQESAKLDRMEELVEEAISNGRKVVVFSNWTSVTDVIMERLHSYRPAIITGETKDNERQEVVDKFQNDDNCKVIVGTIGAMGTGLTLTAGTVEIFVDEPWNMALKEQAIDRCHRIGATSNVTIYTLICKNTIDERVNELVEKKGKIAEALVDGVYSGDKRQLVDFLLS